MVKLLFVDDEPKLQALVTQLLRKNVSTGQYELFFALNGQEALELVATHPGIDIVLTDLNMPVMSGLALLKRLQEIKPAHNPVLTTLVISAYGDMENIRKAMNAGAFDFINKPLDFDDFRATLTKAVAHVDNLRAIHRREQDAHDALEALNRELEDRVQQRTLDLERTNADLNAFAHTVAHDIKNPLGIISGQTDFVLDYMADLSPEEIVDSLTSVRRYAYKALNIVEELMLLSGVRKLAVLISPITMEQVVSHALARLERLKQERGAEISAPQSWPVALGYGPWVEEVWVNYVSNAIKYGGKPPVIELGSLIRPDGTICFWVQDNGQGLTEEDQRVLFTEFTRLNQRDGEGYGLGLSIARRIVEKLGGEVGINSTPGQGSQFYFTLPPA